MPENELKLFFDKAGMRPVKSFDFGEPDTGSKNRATLYIGNASDDWAIREIACNLDDNECVIRHPKELKPREIKEFYIEWDPALGRRKPLDANHLFTGRLKIGG